MIDEIIHRERCRAYDEYLELDYYEEYLDEEGYDEYGDAASDNRRYAEERALKDDIERRITSKK
jgi:hypothetical protein